MYTLDKYYSDILSLSNSLVIKITDIGIAMNNGLSISGLQSDFTDKTKWKYFLNLSGVKHFSNSDVKLNVIETGETISLSAITLAQYPYSLKELRKESDYYKNLIETYPDDQLFIKGCIYPVDITTAINAKDGTILAYNTDYVETQEYDLIDLLQDFIISFLSRWHVSRYTIVEELYLPAMLGVLYANIPNKIINIKLDAINTAQVDSFHLEHFFRSHLDLWDDVQYLRKQDVMWLYKNLPYLMKRIGIDSTLESVLYDIFDNNGMGVGEYLLKRADPVLNKLGYSDLTKTPYEYQDIIAELNGLNKSFTKDYVIQNTIEEVTNLEQTAVTDVLVEKDKNILNYTSARVINDVEYQPYNTTKSKALMLSTLKLFKTNGIDIIAFVIGYWAHFVKNGFYSAMIDYNEPNIVIADDTLVDYVEPNTSQYYTVTPSVGLLILLKQLLYLTGNVNLKLTTLNCAYLLSHDDDRYTSVFNNSYQDGYTEIMMSEIKALYPDAPEPVKDADTFSTYLNSIITFLETVWALDSNSENMIVSSNIKNIIGKMMLSDSYDLTVEGTSHTIDELLALNNITYTITSNFDVILSIRAIIKTFTGIEIDLYQAIENKMDAFADILTKLTSYTLQIINNGVTDDTVNTYYNTIQPIYAKKGLIAVLDSTLIPLEEYYPVMHGIANDFRDKVKTFTIMKNPKAVLRTTPIVGTAEFIQDQSNDIVAFTPRSFGVVELSNIFRYDLLGIEMKDIFLTGVTAVFDPLENNALDMSSVVTNALDRLQASGSSIGIPHIVSETTVIDGNAEIAQTINHDIIADMYVPDAIVEITDTYRVNLIDDPNIIDVTAPIVT